MVCSQGGVHARGKRTVNRVSPSFDVNQRSPPWAVAISLAMKSPSPSPWGLACQPRRKGPNRVSRTAAGMAGRSFVRHLDRNAVRLFDEVDADGSASGRVLEGVPEQVRDDLRDLAEVEGAFRAGRKLASHRSVGMENLELLQHLHDERHDIDFGTLNREATSKPRPGEVKKLQRHRLHPAGGAFNALHRAGVCRGERAALEQAGGRQADGGERSAKVMAQDGDEQVAQALPFLQQVLPLALLALALVLLLLTVRLSALALVLFALALVLPAFALILLLRPLALLLSAFVLLPLAVGLFSATGVKDILASVLARRSAAWCRRTSISVAIRASAGHDAEIATAEASMHVSEVAAPDQPERGPSRGS